MPRPVRRRGVSQSSRFVQVEAKQVDHPGKLGTLVRGAQPEGPKKERKSGVVKVDSRLRGKVL